MQCVNQIDMSLCIRDAEDAVYGRNGYGFGDCKLRVEHPRSASSKFNGSMGGSGRGSGDGGPGGPKGRFGPPTRRSEFRVIVTGKWIQSAFVFFNSKLLFLPFTAG